MATKFKVGDRVRSISERFDGERVVDKIDHTNYSHLANFGWWSNSNLELVTPAPFKKGDYIAATRGTSRVEGWVRSVGDFGHYLDVPTADGATESVYVSANVWTFESAEPPAPPKSTNADILNGLKVGGVFTYGGHSACRYVKVGSKTFADHQGDTASRGYAEQRRVLLFDVSDFPDRFQAVEVTE